MSNMTDKEFLDYCETHSQTDRRLFHYQHISRCFALAGHERVARSWANNGEGYCSINLQDIVAQARRHTERGGVMVEMTQQEIERLALTLPSARLYALADEKRHQEFAPRVDPLLQRWP